MAATRARIGLVGFGYIGQYVYEQIRSRPELGLELAFVYNRSPNRLAQVEPALALADLRNAASRRPDLIVELAHPDITRHFGESFLSTCDYMPLSMTAFADEPLRQRLIETAGRHGTRLFVPHGATVGLENIFEGREIWEEVTMVMKKSPRSLDFSAAPRFNPGAITTPTVLYDGPTRGICAMFPRNVNSHATVALAGIGFERTRSMLIADPGLDVSVIDIMAQGQGVSMRIQRSNPLKGVSGVFTLQSTLAAISRAKGPGSTLQIC